MKPGLFSLISWTSSQTQGVIAHVPQDHRYVTPQELKTVSPYNVIMNKPNTSIMDYAMDKPELFLSSDGTPYYSLSMFVS